MITNSRNDVVCGTLELIILCISMVCFDYIPTPILTQRAQCGPGGKFSIYKQINIPKFQKNKRTVDTMHKRITVIYYYQTVFVLPVCRKRKKYNNI